MSQSLDYVAFDWVTNELEDTIKQARQALELYSQDREDFSKLRFTLTHAHQINGTLRMVQLNNLVELAEEIEAVAQALVNKSTPDDTAALEILMTAFLQLPGLLSRVKKVRADISVQALQPIINRLRAVRGADVSAKRATVDFSAAFSSRVSRSDFDDLMSKLRKMFRVAVLNIARENEVEKNVRYLAQIGQRIHKISQNTVQEYFWRCALGLFEALEEDSLPISNKVANLLLELDKLLINISTSGSDSLKEAAPDDVQASIKALLRSVRSERPLVKDLQEQWDEELQAPGAIESMGPDGETLRSVVDALLEELDSIKDYIDLFVRNRDREEVKLEPTLPVFTQIINTMMVLGLGDALRIVRQQASTIEQMVSGAVPSDNESLMKVAEQIIGVEATLKETVQRENIDTDRQGSEKDRQLDTASSSVVVETRKNIDQVKEFIIEFIAHQWDHARLQSVPTLLSEARGSLAMLPLARAAQVLASCEWYVCDHLLNQKRVPEWQMLDVLADALSSVDYYLEHISVNDVSDSDVILDAAVDSVAELGFPITELHKWQRSPALYANGGSEEDDNLLISDFMVLDEHFDKTDAAALQQEIRTAPEQVPEPADPENRQKMSAASLAAGALAATAATSKTANVSVAGENNAANTARVDSRQASNDDFEPEVGEEIVEIFIEEVDEVLEEMDSHLPTMREHESLQVIRRSFHTLKGSGRMVGARDTGELSWGVENMLNRVVEGSQEITDAHEELIRQARALIPFLVASFAAGSHDANAEAGRLCALADAISTGQSDISSAEQIGPAASNTEFPIGEVSETDALTSGPSSELAEEASAQHDDVQRDLEDAEELQRVFSAEAETHLQSIESAVASYHAGEALVSDDLHRALHTLKGSARIAEFDHIAEYIAPLERYVLELHQLRRDMSSESVNLLSDSVGLVRGDLSLLPDTTDENRAAGQVLLETAQRLRDQLNDIDASSSNDTSGLFGECLTFAMDQVSTSQDLLEDARAGHSPNDALLRISVAQRSVAKKFAELKQPQIRSLALVSAATLEQAAVLQPIPDSVFDLAEQGQEGLASAIDALVAGQDVAELTEINDAIVAFEQFDLDKIRQATLGIPANEINSKGDLSTTDGSAGEQTERLISNWMKTKYESPNSPEKMAEQFFNTDEEGDSAGPIKSSSALFVAATGLLASNAKPAVADGFNKDTETSSLFEPDSAAPVLPAEITQSTTKSGIAEELVDPVDQEILEIFTEEATDLLEDIDETVHAWKEEPSRHSYSEELVRTLHTLKGGARLADIMSLGDLAHHCETFVEKTEREGADFNPVFFANLQQHVDSITLAVDQLRAHGRVEPLDASDAPLESQSEIGSDNAAVVDDDARSDSGSFAKIVPIPSATNSPVSPLAALTPFQAETAPAVYADAAMSTESTRNTQEVVRVSSQLLENLVNLAGETSISRARAEEHVSDFGFSLEEMQGTIERLQDKLRRLEMETEAQILFRQEQVEKKGLENFDPLEMDRYSQLQTLSRSLMESASDLLDLKNTMNDNARDMETLLLQQSRINTDLQEGLMQSRMVPFSRLVPRLRRIVRQVSNELGKTVEFELLNIEGEMDRSILERMLPPLEHMLRNAVDHGIEDADVRRDNNKSTTGLISLGLMREGNEVVIVLEDDGGGIDVAKVRDKAIQAGLMSTDAELSENDILQFVLETGLSTADKLTQISGRGVGMDVVSSEIKQLGGTIDISSQRGVGTKFVIRLPFTVSVNRALTVSVGNDMYAIPLNSIEGIVRISPFELEAYYQPDSPQFEYAGQPYELRYLGSMLGLESASSIKSSGAPLPVVLVRTGDHAVAIQVDGVHGSREVVVKSLGPQFGMVHGVSGATVLGDGRVVVILDLLANIRQQATMAVQQRAPELSFLADSEENAPREDRKVLAMVVDDSVTVRKVTSRFLERHGMEVIVARDGVEAMALLQDNMPDVMLLDIEMPRMDGFEVASEVRHNSRLKDLPIIMITSRTGAKHRDRALAIGVNNYLGKPYQEHELLSAIEELVGSERLLASS